MSQTFVDTGRSVIMREATALGLLADALGESFEKAIKIILDSKGRVIVTGIGKSGHIARKIAATLASTGTPAQFVHPAEASHGDLGMITDPDVVLAISNSGEAPELANLIAFTRRFGNQLIAITSGAGSSLAQHADLAILLPRVAEACHTGVVPTCSTTMTLALGDAMAVALMQHRAFTAEHFHKFHPGGKLGAQLAMVGDLMHKGDAMPLVHENTLMPEVLIEISQKGFGVAGVLNDDGRLSGIVTDGDLRRHMDGLLEQSAAQVMTKDPTTIAPTAIAAQAAAVMNAGNQGRGITCLFVIDTARPVGILHIHDCLRVGLG